MKYNTFIKIAAIATLIAFGTSVFATIVVLQPKPTTNMVHGKVINHGFHKRVPARLTHKHPKNGAVVTKPSTPIY